jgi:hypothetical protein
LICSFNFLIFLAVCLNISTVINIKILTNSNQQTQSYKFTSYRATFLSVVLITEMLEICIQTSYDQNVQLILKSYLPVVYGTPLNNNYALTISSAVHIRRIPLGSSLGGAGPVVLCKTCCVLLCVLEQPRVDNSSTGPNWSHWLKEGPGYNLDTVSTLK